MEKSASDEGREGGEGNEEAGLAGLAQKKKDGDQPESGSELMTNATNKGKETSSQKDNRKKRKKRGKKRKEGLSPAIFKKKGKSPGLLWGDCMEAVEENYQKSQRKGGRGKEGGLDYKIH